MASGYGHSGGGGSLLSVDEAPAPRAKDDASVPADSHGKNRPGLQQDPSPQPRTLWSRLAARWRPAEKASKEREERTQPPRQSRATPEPAFRGSDSRDHEGLNPPAVSPRERADSAGRPYGFQPTAPRDDELWRPMIDPAAVFGEIWRSKRLILGCAILGAVLGVAIAVSTPRAYYAATDILIDPREWAVLDRDAGRGGLQADAALAMIENQIRVMISRPVLRETVERLDLASDTEFNGQGSAGISPSALFGALRGLLSSSGGAGRDGREAIAVSNLGRALSVSRGGRTFVVSVGVMSNDPEKSALIANTVTDVYLDASARIQAGSSGRAADELTARLDELRLGLEQAERAVETFKAENEIIDAQGRLITDDEITRLNDQLSQARARTVELRARAQSARDLDVQAVVTGSLPEQIASGSMTELRAQYTNLQLSADRLAVRLGPRHPELLAVQAQLRGAEQQIRTELSRIVASLQVDLTRAQQQEQELSAELARLKVRQGDLGNELVTLRELEREAAAKRAVYEAFLLRARETGEQRELNTANVTIISEAVPPLLPSGISRAVISGGRPGLRFAAGDRSGGRTRRLDRLARVVAAAPALGARGRQCAGRTAARSALAGRGR
jgi:polysaccharide biosynthesis transport protein